MLIDTSTIRLVDQRELPSTSAATICARLAVFSLFMAPIMRERSRISKSFLCLCFLWCFNSVKIVYMMLFVCTSVLMS